MAWLSRVNFISSDTLSFSDVNNLGNDIRAWGDNVNGGGYTLSNVAISASSGTMGLVIGGTGTTSTLRLRSTSGVGTTGADIIFQAGNNGATEVMRLQNGGNVGIGTASPSVALDVQRSSASVQIRAYTGTVDLSLLASHTGGAGFIGTNSAHPLVFATNGTEKMRIDSSGNVGIGRTPAYQFDVNAVVSRIGDTGVNSYLQLGANATDLNNYLIGCETGSFAFYQGKYGGTASERMRIDSSGNVGIGTASPAYQLQLSSDSAAKPTTNTWTIASDARLKTVLGDYEKGLDAICALRPVRYEYNGLGGMVADGKEHISIVAQEAQEVFPECIGTFQGKLHGDDEEETELLNYNGHAVTFALINAIKELKAKIDILEARN